MSLLEAIRSEFRPIPCWLTHLCDEMIASWEVDVTLTGGIKIYNTGCERERTREYSSVLLRTKRGFAASNIQDATFMDIKLWFNGECVVLSNKERRYVLKRMCQKLVPEASSQVDARKELSALYPEPEKCQDEY